MKMENNASPMAALASLTEAINTLSSQNGTDAYMSAILAIIEAFNATCLDVNPRTTKCNP